MACVMHVCQRLMFRNAEEGKRRERESVLTCGNREKGDGGGEGDVGAPALNPP